MQGWLNLLGFLLVLALALCGEEERAPRRPTPVTETPAPDAAAPRRIDGYFQDDPSPRSDGIGTAFLVAPGLWVTARHVVDQCDNVGLAVDDAHYQPAEGVAMLAGADVALVREAREGAPVPLVRTFAAPAGIGLHVGYPQGRAATVRSDYLGTIWTRTEGDWTGEEPMAAWAEVRRDPDFDGPLSGMSGGPVFDREGQVIGITVRASPRRGRVLTAMPETVRALLEGNAASADPAARPALVDLDRLDATGAAVRAAGSVALIMCDVY